MRETQTSNCRIEPVNGRDDLVNVWRVKRITRQIGNDTECFVWTGSRMEKCYWEN